MIWLLFLLLSLLTGRSLLETQEPVPAAPASYCSPSGDVCFGVEGSGRSTVLRIDTVERYFGRYRLCVRPPAGAESCKSFPIRRRGRTYGSSVRWRAQFPDRGPGRYVATWRLGGRRLGPSQTFVLPG